MLQHPTLDRLDALGLGGMAKAFGELAANAEADRLSHPEWLALLLDRSVLYQRVPKLFASLALARGDGRHARFLAKLGSVQRLILDDWGLEPLDARARHDLLEIFEERYGRRSTIITSQLPIAAWHEVIGDPTYADAILDRLVHNAQRLNLEGDSLRRAKPAPQA